MANLTIRQKFMKFLYGLGLRNFGKELLEDLPMGSPEWMDLVGELLEGKDYESRKLLLRQITSRSGFLKRSPHKQKLVKLLLDFLSRGLTDEKRIVIKFVSANLDLFPRDDDGFKAKIIALTREKKDVKLASAAEALLPALGIDMDDRSMYRTR